jgi:transcriptional regulator with XRE-family HTH domain
MTRAISPEDRPIMEIIGSNIKKYRKKNNMNLMELGKSINVTFQQMQKYESGENAISFLKIYKLSKFLKVPIKHFYKDL